MCAGFCMGIGSTVYATRFAQYGLLGNGILGPGTLLLTFVAKAIYELIYYCKHGRWFKVVNSAWRTKEGKLKAVNLIPMVLNAATNFLYLIVMTFAWRFASIGGINQGIISTLVSFSAVFNIFLFRFCYKESVTKF